MGEQPTRVLNRARRGDPPKLAALLHDNADHPEAAELFNPEKLPGFHDPSRGRGLTAGGPALRPESYASDLNPVAVLINKAMIEIPPKVHRSASSEPGGQQKKQLIAEQWEGTEGLQDIRYYGQWIRDEAEKRIGHLYPR